MTLQPDFFAALNVANKFTGAFAQGAPWLNNVILYDGKLYASNNRQIVEIECGVAGRALITKKMQQLIKAISDLPTTIEVGEWMHFAWGDGRYLKIINDYDHDDVVAKYKELLDKWHGTKEVNIVDLGDELGRGIEIADGAALVGGAFVPRVGFFHGGKGTASTRLISGTADLHLDDLFALRKNELDAAEKATRRKLDRLDDELVRIEREQAQARSQLQRDRQAIAQFADCVEKYQRGDKLNEAEKSQLRPACEPAVKREEAEAKRKALAAVKYELPDKIEEWDRHNESSDGEYAYVTFRRRLPVAEERAVITKRIKETVDQVFEPDFPREAVFAAWQSIGPIEPRAGPP